jgi:prohibitin 1
MQSPIIYEARLKPIDLHVTTGTKDLQTVTISLRILQQPIVEKLPEIHQLLGRDYEKKVFNSIGQEILRTIVAQCNQPCIQMTQTNS